MKKEPSAVLRITVDEKIGTDLIRFVICPLKRGIEIFTDIDEQWEEENQKLVPAQNYEEVLQEWGVKDPNDLPWETLEEGQVYLSGEFEVVGKKKSPEHFKVSPRKRAFMRIDNLEEFFREEVRYLYSDALKGR